MTDQDQPAAGAVGSAVGGAVVVGGAAAALAYAGGAMDGLTGPGQQAPGELEGIEAGQGQSAALTKEQAARFLTQATNGPTRADIDFVSTGGVAWWLLLQFKMGRSQSHWDYLDGLGYPRTFYNGGKAERLWDQSIWRQLVSAPDQLRQRVALALLDIMVVSINGLNVRFPQYAIAAYMDLLLDHTFGNFRELLGAIVTNSAMGEYLTFIGSSKADANGAMPDENFARELMQLFTLGLYELNQDGTLKLDSRGQPIETYSQSDVSELARVFTGLRRTDPRIATPDTHREPLVIDAAENDTGRSTFLGYTVAGGGMKAINAALDVIFRHPNLPPFFARALIQRLVTSNPSPAYVKRVADRFANDGTKVRGDMRSVIIAVLLDPEARSDNAIRAPHTGRLRDTSQRVTGWARAFGATSPSDNWQIGDLTRPLGHSPGHSPSVFNFFRPGFTPPSSELQRRGLVAPELQITDEQLVLEYVNWLEGTIKRGRADVRPDYSALMPLADDPVALVNEVNLLLAAGQLSPATRALMAGAIDTIRVRYDSNRLNRIYSAILMTMVAPEYLVIQ